MSRQRRIRCGPHLLWVQQHSSLLLDALRTLDRRGSVIQVVPRCEIAQRDSLESCHPARGRQMGSVPSRPAASTQESRHPPARPRMSTVAIRGVKQSVGGNIGMSLGVID